MKTITVDTISLDELVKELRKGNRVRLNSIGYFERRETKGRRSRHPITKEEFISDNYFRVKFTPTKTLRDRIQ